MSDSTLWRDEFTRLFELSVPKYQAGHQKAAGLVDTAGGDFFASIGYTGQEFFDFVEDFAKGGEPTLETALAIAAVRRDYFLDEQKGVSSTRRIDMAALPAKDAEVAGIGWLPRIIPKAEAKLRGEMPDDLMYACGGDRKFFRANGIDPADLLREVWKARGDQDAIVRWVEKHRSAVVV
jgi:hypothetical protein